MTSAMNVDMPGQGMGSRLRQARDAAGLSAADVAAKMRVPVRVVESLEADDWERLGAPVFIRGQLRSYACAVGLPADSLVPESSTPIAPPELTPRTYVPAMQRMAEQAARRLVYVVITAAIAVPAWVVTRQHVDEAARPTASLDVLVDDADSGLAGSGNAYPVSPPSPFMASIAPIQSRQAPRARAPAQAALALHFQGESWAEIHAPDGSLLEQALVAAGEERRYSAGEVGRVVLGNAGAVRVETDGRARDLEPYQRANVARFTVSSDGSLAPVAE